MALTFKHLFHSPITVQYPEEKLVVSRRIRGNELVWYPNRCTGCTNCVRCCPQGNIEIITHKGDKKKYIVDKFEVDTGRCMFCGLCVEVCPAKDKSKSGRKAINMAEQPPLREQENANWAFFLGLPDVDRTAFKPTTVKNVALLRPLFEFSGACAGCGETPYVKLVSQLFGDRMIVANATG